MEQSNKGQNSVIFSIAEIIGKMSNQVNFLIRNNKLLSQLDVDMLMENTRRLYDTVCSVQCNMDVDAIPMEVEGMMNADNDDDFDIDDDFDNDNDFDDDFDNDFDNDIDNDIDDDIDDDDDDDIDDDIDDDNDDDNGDDEVETEQDNIIRMDFEIDDDSDNDSNKDSGIRSYIKTPTSTIGERLESSEDNSLASMLQKKSISDLTTAIDLNDRFMFLNELFDSNMEKYNKAIKTLNSFATLLGAKTYMSELQIELQWNCESDAYKKLNDLVERRFI